MSKNSALASLAFAAAMGASTPALATCANTTGSCGNLQPDGTSVTTGDNRNTNNNTSTAVGGNVTVRGLTLGGGAVAAAPAAGCFRGSFGVNIFGVGVNVPGDWDERCATRADIHKLLATHGAECLAVLAAAVAGGQNGPLMQAIRIVAAAKGDTGDTGDPIEAFAKTCQIGNAGREIGNAGREVVILNGPPLENNLNVTCESPAGGRPGLGHGTGHKTRTAGAQHGTCTPK